MSGLLAGMQQGVLRRFLQPDWRDIGQATQELVYALNIDAVHWGQSKSQYLLPSD